MKLFLCVAALFLSPAAAFTQGNPGPFGGLFGRTPSRTGVDYRVFEIRSSGGAQWNDFLSKPGEQEPPFAGVVNNAAASAMFARRSDRLDLRAGSNVEYRHSLTSQRTRGTTIDGGVVLTGRLTTRVSGEMTANYRRSPFYQFYPAFAWLGDGVAVPGLPYDVNTIGYHLGEARVGGSYQYSKSSTLSANASRAETWFPSRSNNNVTLAGYEGLWSRRLNRDFGLRLGYARHEARHHTSALGKFVQEHIEAGVDFNRALTVSPRTTLAFTTDTSILRHPGRDPHYRLNGEILLTRRFQRTWRLQVHGKRATEFLAGFVDPLFVNSLDLSMSGLVSKRVEFVTAAKGSRGRFGYEGERGPFTMAGWLTHVNIAMTRHVAVYSQYGLYHHSAPASLSSLTSIGELSRQTLTVGITAWLPVFVRERIPSDSR